MHTDDSEVQLNQGVADFTGHDEHQLLPQLVAHLREHRTKLRQQWVSRIHDAHLLEAMTRQEMAVETTSVYDNYVEVLETGSVEALQNYARDLSERIIPRGVETHEVVGIVLLLRDVLARSLFEKYQRDLPLLNQVLDAYEPAANRIANTVAVSFVDERERVIHQQQDALRELSTPVLRVRERYQLTDEFVLYAGNVKPHKNLKRLIDAFHLVRKRGLDHLKLVLIGDEISKYTALRRAVHQHQLHKYVRFLGYLPEETLAVMYRLAGVFVFPSLYEGFGLPPLEAMASGTPVVTSNVSSLPEVAGDAAVLVDPYDPQAIADGIYRVLTDERLRRDMVHKGIARAGQFSWEQSVRRVRAIYGEVGA